MEVNMEVTVQDTQHVNQQVIYFSNSFRERLRISFRKEIFGFLVKQNFIAKINYICKIYLTL